VVARQLAVAAALIVGLGGCSFGAAQPASGPPGLPALSAPAAYHSRPPAHPGGTVTIGAWQFPHAFSPYFASQAAAQQVQAAIFDGLLSTDNRLQWYGNLVREVPSVENGGVRQVGSGMDVNYELRPGLRWSDGQPLTPDDVFFTFQAITGPAAAAGFGQEGYDRISGLERRGENGLVAHFRSLYPAYRSLFPAILPRHRLGQIQAQNLGADGYWRKPDVVSGPFTMREAAPFQITLERNGDYVQGRSGMALGGHAAYAERVVFRAYPTRQALLAAVKAGDVQAASDLSERELSTIARLTGVRVTLAAALQYEQVSFNQARVDPNVGGTPPWVGDPPVLEALDLALDRPALERGPLHARSPLAESPVSPLVGWAYASDLGPPSYDLDQARRVLDAAGWRPGADGIRVKNGRRLAFALTTTDDQLLRAGEEEILAEGWRRLGADVAVQNYPSQQLFADFEQDGVLARGLYQAAIWAWIMPADPDSEFSTLHSSRTPGAGQPSSQNYSRCHDTAVDQALAQGRGTLDEGQRGAAYRSFQHAYAQARCEMPLFRRLAIGVVSPRLRNFVLNAGPQGSTWNLVDWWLDS
jgi:peptide/nickel transport system substrate-binding protein